MAATGGEDFIVVSHSESDRKPRMRSKSQMTKKHIQAIMTHAMESQKTFGHLLKHSTPQDEERALATVLGSAAQAREELNPTQTRSRSKSDKRRPTHGSEPSKGSTGDIDDSKTLLPEDSATETCVDVKTLSLSSPRRAKTFEPESVFKRKEIKKKTVEKIVADADAHSKELSDMLEKTRCEASGGELDTGRLGRVLNTAVRSRTKSGFKSVENTPDPEKLTEEFPAQLAPPLDFPPMERTMIIVHRRPRFFFLFGSCCSTTTSQTLD